jgi:hypothetical protein
MFLTNRKGPENIPAVVAEDHYARRFLDAVDQCMVRELGCGLDRPDGARVWVPTPAVITSESFSFTVNVHCSFEAEAADFCSELRWVGVECTNPILQGEILAFVMTIQPSNGRLSPAWDGYTTPPSIKFCQVPCPW